MQAACPETWTDAGALCEDVRWLEDPLVLMLSCSRFSALPCLIRPPTNGECFRGSVQHVLTYIEQLRAIRFTLPFFQTKHSESTLGPQLSAAMLFADWITKSVQVPDEVFNGLKEFLNDQQIVEATMIAVPCM